MGGALKAIGHAVSSIVKSPIFKGLVNLGLSYLTGGMSGLLTSGLSMLTGSKGGGLMSMFGGLAQKLLGGSSLFSGGALGTIADFAKKATGTDDLLSMAKNLFKSASSDLSKAPDTLKQVASQNLSQIFAKQTASLLNFA
jgi:predicted lipid-binding transport protein (Tim44 family)